MRAVRENRRVTCRRGPAERRHVLDSGGRKPRSNGGTLKEVQKEEDKGKNSQGKIRQYWGYNVFNILPRAKHNGQKPKNLAESESRTFAALAVVFFFCPARIQSRWRTYCVSSDCTLDGWQRNSNYAPLMSRLKWHANAVWIYSYLWISLLQDPRPEETRAVALKLQCHSRLIGRRCAQD